MNSASQYGGKQEQVERGASGQAYVVCFVSAAAFAIGFGVGAVHPPRNPVPVSAVGATSVQRCADPADAFPLVRVDRDGLPLCL